jgi:hypothetical protein
MLIWIGPRLLVLKLHCAAICFHAAFGRIDQQNDFTVGERLAKTHRSNSALTFVPDQNHLVSGCANDREFDGC